MGTVFPIGVADLRAIIKAPTADLADFAREFNRQAPGQGVDTRLRAAHFLAQVGHESRFGPRVENLNYSAPRLRQVWPRRFTKSRARRFAHRPETIANTVYGGRLGNGGPETGDGWRYRGRGYLQLTGRENYRKYGRRIGVELETAPDRALEPAAAMAVALAYWKTRNCNRWADADDLKGVTRRVNGGLIGLKSRAALLARARKALDGPRPEAPPAEAPPPAAPTSQSTDRSAAEPANTRLGAGLGAALMAAVGALAVWLSMKG